MKQAIYQGVKSIEIREAEKPACSPDSVVVKNLCSSICGTDVSAYFHGGEFAGIHPGNEFGHEMVSQVVEVGANVADLKVGQRVFPTMMAKADPSRAGTIGGYSEYIEMPHPRAGMSYFVIDDEISDECASLVEPLSVGMHAARLTQPTKESRAVVFGAGMIGMASAIALRYLGVEKIMITDVSDMRLDIARAFDFETCNVKSESYPDRAKAFFGEARGKVNADIYIDAAGVVSNINLFLDTAMFGAKYCVAAVYHQDVPINLMKLTFGQFQILGSPAYNFTDIPLVLDMLKSHRFPMEKLITQRYGLEQIEEAINVAADASKSMKVIIDYRG